MKAFLRIRIKFHLYFPQYIILIVEDTFPISISTLSVFISFDVFSVLLYNNNIMTPEAFFYIITPLHITGSIPKISCGKRCIYVFGNIRRLMDKSQYALILCKLSLASSD